MSKKTPLQSILTVLATVAVLYVLLGLLLFLFQERLVFLPSSAMIATPAQTGMSYEEVWFESENGRSLHGWFIPANPEADLNEAVTILFCHGNAGNISGRVSLMQTYHAAGFNVFIFDYQGYGKSEGRPNETNILKDGLAAWDFLVDEVGADPEMILPVGRSLGGPIAAYIALHRGAKAVAVESTFTSVPDIARQTYPIYPVGLLARIKLPTLEFVKAYEGAVLVAHSREDTLIPYSMGQAIYDAVPGPKQWLELSGDHNEGYIVTGRNYSEAYINFAQQHFDLHF